MSSSASLGLELFGGVGVSLWPSSVALCLAPLVRAPSNAGVSIPVSACGSTGVETLAYDDSELTRLTCCSSRHRCLAVDEERD